MQLKYPLFQSDLPAHPKRSSIVEFERLLHEHKKRNGERNTSRRYGQSQHDVSKTTHPKVFK